MSEPSVTSHFDVIEERKLANRCFHAMVISVRLEWWMMPFPQDQIVLKTVEFLTVQSSSFSTQRIVRDGQGKDREKPSMDRMTTEPDGRDFIIYGTAFRTFGNITNFWQALK
ncbi:hypothetical protein YC2023_060235 [Brassica napus]